jgi:hypothetical protein
MCVFFAHIFTYIAYAGDSLFRALTIEKSGGLFEREPLGLDNEQVEEDQFKGNPAAIDNLWNKLNKVEGGRT